MGVRLPEEVVEFAEFVLWELVWRLLVMNAGRAEVNASSTPCHRSTESYAPWHKGSEGKDNITEKAGKTLKESYQAISDVKLNEAEYLYPLEDDNPKDNEIKNGAEVNILKEERFEVEEDLGKEYLDDTVDDEIDVEAMESVDKEDTTGSKEGRTYGYPVIKNPYVLVNNWKQVGVCTSCGSYCNLVYVCGTVGYCSVVCQKSQWTIRTVVCPPYCGDPNRGLVTTKNIMVEERLTKQEIDEWGGVISHASDHRAMGSTLGCAAL